MTRLPRGPSPRSSRCAGCGPVFAGHPVLAIDSLRIAEGGVTVLVGENGSGKTTLLRLLNGLLDPAEGQHPVPRAPVRRGSGPTARLPAVLPCARSR